MRGFANFVILPLLFVHLLNLPVLRRDRAIEGSTELLTLLLMLSPLITRWMHGVEKPIAPERPEEPLD